MTSSMKKVQGVLSASCLITVNDDQGRPSQYVLEMTEIDERFVVSFCRTDAVVVEHLTQSFPRNFLGGGYLKIMKEAISRARSTIGKLRGIHHAQAHFGDRSMDLVEPIDEGW